MVYLTLKGGTQLLSFKDDEERTKYCQNRGIFQYPEQHPEFTDEDKRNVMKNFPFFPTNEV